MFAGVAVIGVSLLLGLLIGAWVGVAAFVIAVAVAGIAYLRADNPDQRTPLRDAEHAPHPHGAPAGTRHVLVVANETLAGDELGKRIIHTNGRPVELDVLAPVLTSELHYAMSDIDNEPAHGRDSSVRWHGPTTTVSLRAARSVTPIRRPHSPMNCATSAPTKSSSSHIRASARPGRSAANWSGCAVSWTSQ